MTVLSFDGLEFEWVEMESGRVAVGVDEVVKYLDGNIKHISRYVRDIFPDYKFQWSAGVSGRPKWYVYEPGVYQLIFSSSLATIAPPKVERFQRWVFSDVLPAIRKHGGYISPDATPDQLIALQNQIDIQQYQILTMGRELQEAQIEKQRIAKEKADWECHTDMDNNPVAFVKHLKYELSIVKKEFNKREDRHQIILKEEIEKVLGDQIKFKPLVEDIMAALPKMKQSLAKIQLQTILARHYNIL